MASGKTGIDGMGVPIKVSPKVVGAVLVGCNLVDVVFPLGRVKKEPNTEDWSF